MAQEVFLAIQDADTIELVQKGTTEDVDNFLLPPTRTAENGRDSQNDLWEQLEDALAQSDVVEVWKLIAKINEAKSNKTLNEVCKTIEERENSEKTCETIKNSSCESGNVDEREGTMTEMRSKERRWIKILSNPLYISLEWLSRNSPDSCQDIIEAAFDEVCSLKKIASYEHFYSRAEYKLRAEEYETFAADIVEQVDKLNQLHQIMDIKGTGSLLNETHADFDQSLSLLKLATDKQRKQVGIRLDGVILRLVILSPCSNSLFLKL